MPQCDHAKVEVIHANDKTPQLKICGKFLELLYTSDFVTKLAP